MMVITTRHSLGTNTVGVRPTVEHQAPPLKRCAPQNARYWGEGMWGRGVEPFPHLLPHWVLTTAVPLSETKDPQSRSPAPPLPRHCENDRATSLIPLVAFTQRVMITAEAGQPCKNEAVAGELGRGGGSVARPGRPTGVSFQCPLDHQLTRESLPGTAGILPLFPTSASGHSVT